MSLACPSPEEHEGHGGAEGEADSQAQAQVSAQAVVRTLRGCGYHLHSQRHPLIYRRRFRRHCK